MNNNVRVRIAPSPTGNLHLGTARAALFNYLFAKTSGGKFILRIEDTDKQRSKPEFEKDIIDSMKWLGLEWDEGPDVGGKFAPYRQSERLSTYEKYIDQLLEEGNAYYCFCSSEDLEKERSLAEKAKKAYIYSGKCREISLSQARTRIQKGEKATVRFKTNSKKIIFQDLIRGEISVESATLGDFVIVKSDHIPLFLLASVIDDIQMQISHVIRGEDHISNTPKQILILEALGLNPPMYGHLPLIVNPDKSKLSKRKNPTSIKYDYIDKGYLSDALINFMAFLGWNPKDEREFFTLSELEAIWKIENVGKSPAVFDLKKLDFINGHYLRKLTQEELSGQILKILERTNSPILNLVKRDLDYFQKACALIQEKIKVVSEAEENLKPFYTEIVLDYEVIFEKGLDKIKAPVIFKEMIEKLSQEKDYSRERIEIILRSTASSFGQKDGSLLWAVRYVLTGQKASPGAFEMICALGPTKTLERLQKGLNLISKSKI